MKRKLVCLVITLFVSTVMLISCSSDKAPAELAIKTAEEAVDSVKAETAKYIPAQVKSLEDTLAEVKDKFAKKEYKAAITEAQSLAGKAREALEAAKAKKEELAVNWTALSGEVPKMIEAIQGRVDTLSKSKKLPTDLTAEQFAEVESGLAALKKEWATAVEGFNAGNIADAVSMANSVKEKSEKTIEILGVPSTQAAPGKIPATVAREKAPIAKKAPAPKKQAAKPEARTSGYTGKVTEVDAKTMVVKGEKGPVAFSVRNPKLRGYKGIGDVTIGDTVAAMYTKHGKGIIITKIKGKAATAKKAPVSKKLPKAEKAAPAPAR